MDPLSFFLQPNIPAHTQYEALRAFYVDHLSLEEICQQFHYSPAYFTKLRRQFLQHLQTGTTPFFLEHKPGPTHPHTVPSVTEHVVALRKQNLSVPDIRMALQAQGQALCLDTIDQILKREGFAPLPRRTRQEKHQAQLPATLPGLPCSPLAWTDETFHTEQGAGPLLFLPLLEDLGILPAIDRAGFPETANLHARASVLSFLALKLAGYSRYSHDELWSLDRALGLFADLTVLPKSATLSSYSYRVSRSMNRQLLQALVTIFQQPSTPDTGEFNLDFKAIPYWGDASVLEKHWSGMHTRALTSVLALIVEEPATGYLSYTNAELSHATQSDAVLEFVDFWTTDGHAAPKMLIFDSKFTTYQNLHHLNQHQPPIKFLTLRRRGQQLLRYADALTPDQWQSVRVEGQHRKHKLLKVHGHDHELAAVYWPCSATSSDQPWPASPHVSHHQ